MTFHRPERDGPRLGGFGVTEIRRQAKCDTGSLIRRQIGHSLLEGQLVLWQGVGRRVAFGFENSLRAPLSRPAERAPLSGCLL